jgi:DNA-binding NarL/FixJ family response regulator
VIRVLLVDDQALLRSGLRALLDSEAEADIVVTGEAASGEEAVTLARRLRPDVVLMDISMPGIGGVAATREILAARLSPMPRILVVTTFDSPENTLQALRAGASGFLPKDTEPSDLLRAIRLLAAGQAVLSPSATRHVIVELAARPEHRDVTPEQLRWLTRREREVMTLVAGGLTNAQIAAELVISPATAKTHVSRTMRKLRAHDRAQLVALAYASGLVLPGGAPAAAAGVS